MASKRCSLLRRLATVAVVGLLSAAGLPSAAAQDASESAEPNASAAAAQPDWSALQSQFVRYTLGANSAVMVEVGAGPIQVQQDGVWRQLDMALNRAGRTWVPAVPGDSVALAAGKIRRGAALASASTSAALLDGAAASLAARAAAGVSQVGKGNGSSDPSVSIAAAGPVKARKSGSTVAYSAKKIGVITISPTPRGFEWSTAATGKKGVVLPLTTRAVSPRVSGNTVQLVDPSGRVVGSSGPITIMDRRGHIRQAKISLSRGRGKATMRIRAAKGMQVRGGFAFGTDPAGSVSAAGVSSRGLLAGTSAGSRAGTLLRFTPNVALPETALTAASLRVFTSATERCRPNATLSVQPVLGQWQTGQRWDQLPALGAQIGSAVPGCGDTATRIPLSGEAAVSATKAETAGLWVSSTDRGSARTLCGPGSCNARAWNGGMAPALELSYGAAPTTVTPDAAPVPLPPTGASVSPKSGRWTNSARPSLMASFMATDSTTVDGVFTVRELGGQQVWTTTKTGVPVGLPTSVTMDQSLSDGVTYQFIAASQISGGGEKAEADPVTFTIDLNNPDNAQVSADDGVTDGSWTPNPTDPTIQFTFTSMSSDLSSFAVQQDEESVVTVPVDGSSGSLPWSPGDGFHTVRAWAIDRAGNRQANPTVFRFGLGGPGTRAPFAQMRSTAVFPVQAAMQDPGGDTSQIATQVQWRVGSGMGWQPVTTGLTVAGTGQAWNGHVAVEGPAAVTPVVYWDSSSVSAPEIAAPAVVDVRVCFTPSGQAQTCTGVAQVQRVQAAFGSNFATAPAGGGSVALKTGEFQLGATDAVLPGNGGISISRAWSSFSSTSTGIFGPGWKATVPAAATAAQDATVVDDSATNKTIVLQYPDGTLQTYAGPGGDGRYTPTGLTAQQGGYLDLAGASLKLTDAAGTVTTWAFQGGGWVATTAKEALAQGAYKNFNTDPAAGVAGVRATVTGHYLNGGTPAECSALATVDDALTKPGCRTLRVDLAPTDTAASSSGDHAGQATQARITLYDQGSAQMITQTIARYAYNTDGLLVEQWNPQLQNGDLRTRYEYGGSAGAGWRLTRTLAAVNPGSGDAGLTPIEYGYSNDGQLTRVTRNDPALGQDATIRYVYNVAVNGSGLPDMRPETVATWNQSAISAPTTGTAVFPANMGSSFDPNNVSADDWKHAAITYMTVNGVAVNTAAYGNGEWQVATTNYDTTGQIVSTLAPSGRKFALNPVSDGVNCGSTTFGVSPYVCAQAGSAAKAEALSSFTQYESPGVVSDQVGPVIQVNGDDIAGPARLWTHTEHDDSGAPQSVKDSGAALPTLTATGSFLMDEATLIPTRPQLNRRLQTSIVGVTLRQTTFSYASTIGGSNGWNLRKPTKTSILMSDGDPITSYAAYNAAGNVTESRMPDSNGNDAGTTINTYYTAEPSATTECGSKPAWEGLLCKTSPKSDPGDGNRIPVTTTSYSTLLQTSKVYTRSLLAEATTTATYDDAGRQLTSAVSSGVGAAVPTQTFGYDQNTGLPTTISTPDATITTGYDSWGRVTSYNDGQGNTSSTSYTIDSQVHVVDDGKGTSTYTYNRDGQDADYRGLPSKLEVEVGSSLPGTFVAAYNADGAIATEGGPSSMVGLHSYSADGTPAQLKLVNPDLSFAAWSSQFVGPTGDTAGSFSLAGAADAQGTTLPGWFGQAQGYTYDDAGRLTYAGTIRTADEGGKTCSTTTYTFNGNSDRLTSATKSATFANLPEFIKKCGDPSALTPVTSTATSFNSADQATTSVRTTATGTRSPRSGNGYTYDGLARTTTVPASDTATGTELSQTYFADSGIHTQTSGTTTQTWTRDAARRLSTSTQTTGTTDIVTTSHYADASDNPAWIKDNSSNTWTRYIGGLGAISLAATGGGNTTQASAARIALSDLQGNIVSTIRDAQTLDTTTAANITSYTPYGEEIPGNQQTPPTPYGYKGTDQRSNNAQAGTILMGARQYNPTSGRFLTPDPIPGGNANTYTYPTNPIDQEDPTGAADRYVGPSNGRWNDNLWTVGEHVSVGRPGRWINDAGQANRLNFRDCQEFCV